MTSMPRRAVPLLALLLLAACSAPGPARPRPHWTDEPPRGALSVDLDHEVSGSRDGLDKARFEVVSGVTAVTVRVDDLGGDLYRVSTPDGAQIAPLVRRDDDELRLLVEGTGLGGPATVDVLLNRAVRWELRFAGGAQDQQVDLRGGDVSSVDFAAGAGRIGITLPEPHGTVPIRMTGGTGDFLIRMPDGVPARARISGGAGSVVVDGVARSGIPSGTVIEGPGWSSAANRYDVDVAAGVSSLVLDHV